jgi:hypothetical protein
MSLSELWNRVEENRAWRAFLVDVTVLFFHCVLMASTRKESALLAAKHP